MNIIFDLDGTLIDSAPDIQCVAAAVLARYDRKALTLDETRQFIGEGSAVFVRRMMAARDLQQTAVPFAVLHESFLSQYEYAVDKAVFYPGVRQTLATLKAAGHKLGLCTNKPQRPAHAVLRHMNLDEFFTTVVAAGMLPSRKPEPDMLLHAIESLGGGAALYVGDSEIDAETAVRAGVIFALYSGGYRKLPVSEMQWDWSFDCFDALPGIVREAMQRTS